MCNMPIPFGAEYNPSYGSYAQPYGDKMRAQPQTYPISSSSFTPMHAQPEGHDPNYMTRKSFPESHQVFPYFSNGMTAFPHQESPYQYFGQEPVSSSYPNYQYTPVHQQTIAAHPSFQSHGMVNDLKLANGPSYGMQGSGQSGTICAKCGSFTSANAYYPNSQTVPYEPRVLIDDGDGMNKQMRGFDQKSYLPIARKPRKPFR